jgi:hypothetical protein
MVLVSLTGAVMKNNQQAAFSAIAFVFAVSSSLCFAQAKPLVVQGEPSRALPVSPTPTQTPTGNVIFSGTISNPQSSLCLDLNPTQTGDGTNVQLGACSNFSASWDIVDLNDGSFALMNRSTRRALDVAGGGTNDGTNVQSVGWNTSPAQRWRFRQVANGVFQISGVGSGKCIDITGNATNVGANAQTWGCHGRANQQWRIAIDANRVNILTGARPSTTAPVLGGQAAVASSAGVASVFNTPNRGQALTLQNGRLNGTLIYSGMIVSMDSGKCIDVNQGQTNDNANIQQWTCNRSDAQLWDFYDLGNNEVAIALRKSNKVMDVNQASRNNGANISQFSWTGGANQRWRLEPAGRGVFRMVSTGSNKCADVDQANDGKRDGANVSQWDCHGKPNQLWRVEVFGSSSAWNDYNTSSGVLAGGSTSAYSDRPPMNIVGTWEGRNPLNGSIVRLAIYQDGNAEALIDGRLRVNGYYRNNQLYLGTERYDVQAQRRGIRTVQVGNANNVINYNSAR